MGILMEVEVLSSESSKRQFSFPCNKDAEMREGELGGSVVLETWRVDSKTWSCRFREEARWEREKNITG
jgi:hypothetical protein